MFNISEYIRSNKKLREMDFATVYVVIAELCKDKKLVMSGAV